MNTPQRSDNNHFLYQWGSLCLALLTFGGFIAYDQFMDYQRIDTQERLRLAMQAGFGVISVFSALGLFFIQKRRQEKFTELKIAEETLRESEEHHRTILQAAIDGIWLVDMEGRLLEVNESYCRMSGYSLPELQAMCISDLEASGTAEYTTVCIRKVMALGEDRFESRHRRKDGSFFDVEISVQYLPSGRRGLVAFLRDITNRKMEEQALLALKDTLHKQYEDLQVKEESLRDQNDELQATEEMLRVQVEEYEDSQRLLKESEERFRALHDGTFSGIMIHDNGLIIDCNQALSDITGFTNEELIGMDAFKLVAPDWLDRVVLNTQNGFDQHYEVVGLRKNGTKYPLSLRGKFIPYKDCTARVIEFRDISELKLAEESLRKSKRQYDNLVSKISVGIYILRSTLEGAFALEYVSPVMAEMLNLSVESLLTDVQILFQSIHPDDLDSFVKLNQEGILKLQPFNWKGRFLVDGLVKWLHFKSSPEPIENGFVLWHGVVNNITENKKHEEELLKMGKLESLGVLAGGIAHDFNNILTGIMGNISLAQVFLDATHNSFKPLAEAETASIRASELAHQLMTFARGGTPVKKLVSVQLLVNESVSLVLHGSNVKASVDIPDSIHAIEADEGQMSQVFHNIIINATQAMPRGGTLAITAQNEMLTDNNSLLLTPGSYIRLIFTDQGCGISDDNLKKIFDPYFTTKLTGSGLGLSSVDSIVNRHGGHIGVDSIVNKGTTFTIHLPSIGEIDLSHQTDSVIYSTEDRSGGSILVMDDEEMIRNMTTEMLLYMGYQVMTCENGSEAITMYNAARKSGNPFSAVIMDLTIPGGMGGKVAAEQILAIDPNARLIVSSGYSNDPIMSDYSEYGFNAAVAKPYSITDLRHQLDSVLSEKTTKIY